MHIISTLPSILKKIPFLALPAAGKHFWSVFESRGLAMPYNICRSSSSHNSCHSSKLITVQVASSKKNIKNEGFNHTRLTDNIT